MYLSKNSLTFSPYREYRLWNYPSCRMLPVFYANVLPERRMPQNVLLHNRGQSLIWNILWSFSAVAWMFEGVFHSHKHPVRQVVEGPLLDISNHSFGMPFLLTLNYNSPRFAVNSFCQHWDLSENNCNQRNHVWCTINNLTNKKNQT